MRATVNAGSERSEHRTRTNTGAEALSCYTANLATYLGRYRDDALDHIAASVRLAVRDDLPDDALAFSHHAKPLNVLPDQSRLVYTGDPDPAAALRAVARELAECGQALVVSNTATMDWSVTNGAAAAPHFLLVDGARPDGWHVDDRFVALRPGGEQQRPFAGWVSTATLVRCLTPIAPLPVPQRLRNQHAFGLPVALPPDGSYQWLTRAQPSVEPDLTEPWVTDDAEVLDRLERFWSALPARPERGRFLDDIWAAAQHHTFRYARLVSTVDLTGPEATALDLAIQAWRDLPMALHFAAQSGGRGRPRGSLVTSTFARLRPAELAAHEVAAALFSTIGSKR
jgi:hypothetical protein